MAVDNIVFEIDKGDYLSKLYGPLDRNIKAIERELKVDINIKENQLTITGEADRIKDAEKVIKTLIKAIERNENIDIQTVRSVIDVRIKNSQNDYREFFNSSIGVNYMGKAIRPKSWGQKRYIDSFSNNDIVFGIGPAGTGKTFLAIAKACEELKRDKINRIIITRPAVEAGENLGFLPGDLQEKVDPYLRPIYDSLYTILGLNTYTKYMEKGIIEIAPLAYMRGRTLEDSYVIVDEAQNTTDEQMKMVLTRLGRNSKMIITGDITQVDLKKGANSGLVNIQNILKDIEGIDFIYLTKDDIVRHNIVQKIVEAYEKYSGD